MPRTAAPNELPNSSHDPGGAACMGHLVGSGDRGRSGHNGDGDGPETGAADDEAEDEDGFVGVGTDLGVDDRAGEREHEAGQHDRAGAEAVQLAGEVTGEEHPDPLGGEEQAGTKGALPTHLLVVEGEEEQDTVKRQPGEEHEAGRGGEGAHLEQSQVEHRRRRAPKACQAYVPNSARPPASGAMTMVWLKPPWVPTSVSP